jgi:hypothetical protein
MGLEAIAIASSITSMASSGASAYQAHETASVQKKQMREAKKKEEEEYNAQQKKQKSISDNYANMQTNLYSGGVGGIKTGNLVQ